MSGGQKQRLALAAAVIHEPELLFLDEPTSAVDPESRRDFWEKLFELADAGTTLLVSTHLMDEAERCHRLAILDRGALVADGTPDQLTARLAGRTFLVDTAEPRRAQQTAGRRRRRAGRGPGRQQPARPHRGRQRCGGRCGADERAHWRRPASAPTWWPRRRTSRTCSSRPPATRRRHANAGTLHERGGGCGPSCIKELRQLRRDRITLAMIMGIPVTAAGAVRLRHQHQPARPGRRHRRPGAIPPARARW